MNCIVVGDAIVDEAVELRSLGPSAEGVPTCTPVRECSTAGGSANVAKHLARLGQRVLLLHEGRGPFTFEDDGMTEEERRRIVQDYTGTGQNTVKRRFYVDGRKVLKVDVYPDPRDPNPYFIEEIQEYLGEWDGPVLACDNGHGMFSPRFRQELVQLCKAYRRELFVDAQFSQSEPDFKSWVGAGTLFVNGSELASMAKQGVNLLDFDYVHMKRGALGSEFITQGTWGGEEYGYRVDVVDTVGAGDAYMAAWVARRDLKFANAWAALSCKRRGTQLPELSEIGELDASLA